MDRLEPNYHDFTSLRRPCSLCSVVDRALALLLFAILVMHCSVSGQTLLVADDLQLRGAQPSQSIPIHMEATSAQPIELKLDWISSPMIDGKKSIVNVLINGQIRSTRRVSDLEGNAWRISLRPLNPGNHILTLQAQLRGKDDDCLPLPDSLWLTLLNGSTIKGALKGGGIEKRESLAVRDFPAKWKATHVSAAAQDQRARPSVLLAHDFAWKEQAQSAWLRALQFLHQNGLNAQTKPDAGSQTATERKLTLRSFDRLPAEHPARKRWESEKNTLFALHAVSESHLEIIAKSPENLNRALDLMHDEERRKVCHERLCSVSDIDVTIERAANTRNASADTPALWRMTAGDQPRGWTAQGVGTHRLRQVWVRPLATEFQSDVYLHLAARASQAEQIDFLQSSINVRINDQPLATYSLSNWKSSTAKIRIPQSLWRANIWVIDFDVRLVSRNLQRCSFLVQDDYWVAIDPETQVEAMYKMVEPIGIAGFWQRAVTSPAVHVTWAEAASKAPTEQQLALFTPLLQALQASPSEATSPRITLVSKSQCKTSPCVILHSDASASWANEEVLSWKRAFGQVPDQVKDIPDLGTKGTAALLWVPPDQGNAEQLHLVLGSRSDSTLPVPPLSTFSGSIALHTDQWQFFSDESAFRSNLNASPAGAGNTSAQQGRLRWVNLIWALISITIVAGFAIVYWRKHRKPDPKTWEVN